MKCEKHRDKEGVGFCVECGSGVCEDCIVKSDNKTYCKECKSKLEKKHPKIKIALIPLFVKNVADCTNLKRENL